MIDGVTVVSKFPIATKFEMWFCFCVAVVFFALTMWAVYCQKDCGGFEGIIALCAMVCIVLVFVGVYAHKQTTVFRYKVLISDKVNFVEFNEKYEIISQEGLIYTVEERKQEK